MSPVTARLSARLPSPPSPGRLLLSAPPSSPARSLATFSSRAQKSRLSTSSSCSVSAKRTLPDQGRRPPATARPQKTPAPPFAHISAPPRRHFALSSLTMGRENIMHYQLQHDHETDIPRDVAGSKAAPPERSPAKPAAAHGNFPFTLSKESSVQDFLANNKYFVDSIHHNHSNQIFELNGKGQSPHTLWIGCSDSRAGEACLATLPGEIFTHRNIANIINANDISSQGVIQFAVDVLKVRKIVICGHTDCGGVWASLSNKRIGGVLDLWLNPIRHIRAANVELLNSLKDDPPARAKKLAELNVIASVLALKRHPSASMALKKGDIEVWGMMYDVGSGYLSEIEIPDDEFEDLFHVSDDHEDEHKAH